MNLNSLAFKTSILICTHNRAKILEKTLISIWDSFNLSPSKLEVLIMNNASTDDTSNIVDQFVKTHQHQDLSFIYEFEPKIGKSYALIRGMHLMTGDYVLFLDDDNFFIPTTYSAIVENINKYPKAIIASTNRPIFETTPPFWFNQFQAAFACGPQEAHTKVTDAVWGAGMLAPAKYVKRLLEAGFQFNVTCRKGKSLSSGSDTELTLALRIMGLKVVFPENYILMHLMNSERFCFSYLFRLYYSFGKSDPILIPYRRYWHANRRIEYLHLPSTLHAYIRQMWRYFIKIKFTGWQRSLAEITQVIYHFAFIVAVLKNYRSLPEINENIMEFCVKLSALPNAEDEA